MAKNKRAITRGFTLIEMSVVLLIIAVVTHLAMRQLGAQFDDRKAAAATMQKLSAGVAGKGWQLIPGEIVGSDTGATTTFSFELKRTR